MISNYRHSTRSFCSSYRGYNSTWRSQASHQHLLLPHAGRTEQPCVHCCLSSSSLRCPRPRARWWPLSHRLAGPEDSMEHERAFWRLCSRQTCLIRRAARCVRFSALLPELQASLGQSTAITKLTRRHTESIQPNNPQPIGLIQDACCDYQTVEDMNQEMAHRLDQLTKLPFFRYQKVDLFRECPFWQEDGSCMNRACAVQETEEVS